ncbi:hypothetical protein [Clostridium guangxiense]|uniref:hypothetical protein n=1 Tax=Clostridium guangxiense TaxID=1662055 RepID=UPI001E2A26C1|nr:hypothetical protein [Clostridium guangxiense]MCD2346176.1 hypothetical protein [Clostridium guangxiense]
MSNEMLITFRYNNALNYYNLKNYIIALNNLRIAEKLVSTSNKESYFLIQNNLGGYLFDMGNYTEALDVFTALISYLDKNITDKYVMTLLNVVNACLSLSKQYEALENFNIALNELKNLNNTSYMADIYYEIGKIYKRLNKIDLSESYCLNVVNFAENYKNYVLLSKILCDLIDIYSNSHNIKKMEYVKNKLLK